MPTETHTKYLISVNIYKHIYKLDTNKLNNKEPFGYVA